MCPKPAFQCHTWRHLVVHMWPCSWHGRGIRDDILLHGAVTQFRITSCPPFRAAQCQIAACDIMPSHAVDITPTCNTAIERTLCLTVRTECHRPGNRPRGRGAASIRRGIPSRYSDGARNPKEQPGTHTHAQYWQGSWRHRIRAALRDRHGDAELLLS